MNQKTFFMAFITILIWGSTFAAIGASLEGGYEAGHLVLVRYLIASLLFLIYALFNRKQLKKPTKNDLLKIIILGWVGISVYHIGVTFGIQTIPAGTAGMLIGAAPIFTAVIAMLVLKERLTVLGWVGLGVGFAGIVLIAVGSSGSSFSLASGALFVLGAAIATSIFFVFQKPLLTRYNPIELTAYFTWAGTLPFFIFSPGLLDTLQQATAEAHLSAIYVGIFPACIAYVTWAKALSSGNASAVASMMYLEPAIAIAVAWVWLKEWPETLSITGGIVALAGVIIINALGRNKAGSKLGLNE
ncbi:MAG: DMT family transporter [Planococcus sp. (in: firmicutes)]|uniref:DMT family transporter n=1 Tax=Planococcus alpniumensis TaxID=2708345 RepID=UPI001B8D2B9B|nr:DMT family transporter [Planococcus sp. (in: firmicutes)]